MNSTTSSLVCQMDTGAFDPIQSQRYKFLKEDMRNAVSEIKELPDGFAFRFPSDPRIIVNLAEWIALERQCCAFFSFVLEVEPDEGPVWLSLTGSKGVKEFLEAEISARQGQPIQRQAGQLARTDCVQLTILPVDEAFELGRLAFSELLAY